MFIFFLTSKSRAGSQTKMRKSSTASPAGKKCAKCNESLGQYAVTTKDGKMYHQSCFACAKCQEPMAGPYVEVPPAPVLGRKSPLCASRVSSCRRVVVSSCRRVVVSCVVLHL